MLDLVTLQVRAEEIGNLNDSLRLSFKAQKLDKKVSLNNFVMMSHTEKECYAYCIELMYITEVTVQKKCTDVINYKLYLVHACSEAHGIDEKTHG